MLVSFSDPTHMKTQSDWLPVNPNNVTCHDGYVFADGSSIKIAILNNAPGVPKTESFDLRILLELPSGRQVVVFNRLPVPVFPTGSETVTTGICDDTIATWCARKADIDLAALAGWLVPRINVTVADCSKEPDDLTVRFSFEIALQNADEPARTLSRSMSYHANVIPGFFVTGSGKVAISISDAEAANGDNGTSEPVSVPEPVSEQLPSW